MKKIMIIIATVAIGFSSCKKDDYLTRKQLQEELDKNKEDLEFDGWDKLNSNGIWYDDSVLNQAFIFGDMNSFPKYRNAMIFSSSNYVQYAWKNHHKEIIIYFDSTNLISSVASILAAPEDNYLKGLLLKQVENDVLELIMVTNKKAILYSRELKKYLTLIKSF